MTDKEYLEKLNDLRKLYISVCTLLKHPIFANYDIAFGWHDKYGNNPNSTEFYELEGKYSAMLDGTINDDNKDITIDHSLLLWKRLMEWGARLLDWCEEAMSMQEYGAVFKEGQSGYVYDSKALTEIKEAHRLEKVLGVTYSNDFKSITLGIITTKNASEPTQPKGETEATNETSSYVRYSDYKLLLRRMKTMEDTIKKLKDELEVVHSQLDYLSDHQDENSNKPELDD